MSVIEEFLKWWLTKRDQVRLFLILSWNSLFTRVVFRLWFLCYLCFQPMKFSSISSTSNQTNTRQNVSFQSRLYDILSNFSPSLTSLCHSFYYNSLIKIRYSLTNALCISCTNWITCVEVFCTVWLGIETVDI